MTIPRTDPQGRVCLNDIRAEFGRDPRFAPGLFLARTPHAAGEVEATKGRYGTTYASPPLAEQYRAFLQRMTGSVVPSTKRKGRGGRLYTIAQLAQMAGIQPETLKDALMRHGLAYPKRAPSYVQQRLVPSIPGERYATKVQGEWHWHVSILGKIGM